MSRSGRAVELLNDWRDHPRGCRAEHSGWADGYEGPCTDDPWDIVENLYLIDPMFQRDEIEKLRAEVAAAEERGFDRGVRAAGSGPALAAVRAEAEWRGAEKERERADGVGLIAAERRRQITQEGYFASHDDREDHARGELARAAAMYALPPEYRYTDVLGAMWPRHWQFKPTEDRMRELTKAGALIAAEIDRIARGAS
jgi:hypothetical protein